MLNIYIPKEPQLNDYGISEKEIPEIENINIKPIKKAQKREDVLLNYSIALFVVFFYFFLLVLFYNKSGWYVKTGDSEMSIFIFAGMLLFFLWFPFPLVFLGCIPVKYFLDKIIPSSVLHDRDNEYSKKDNVKIMKKDKLSLYKTAHSQWRKEMNMINKSFPNVEKIIPIGTSIQNPLYKLYELQYISWCIKNVFMPDFKSAVEYADKMEFKRSQEDWWRSLSPYDFEKETGNWFLNKGFKVNVTQANIDGGVDIIVSKDGVKSYVQCKHYKDLVPINVVRELKGVMSIENVSSGYLVCINGCTTGAQDFAKKSNIVIITLKDLVRVSTSKHCAEREFQDVESKYITLFKYGEYSIFKFAIKDLDDANNSVNNIMTWLLNREGKAFGLFRCYGFYILVYSFTSSLTRLNNVHKVYDAVSGKIIKSNTKGVDNKPYKSTRKNYSRGRRYGYKRWYYL